MEKFAKAAEQFAPVLAAAIHPERLPDDDKAKEALLREIGAKCGEMGDCFLAANRLREARAAFEKHNEWQPNRAMLEFNLARVAAQSDKPAEALSRLEKALQSHVAARGAGPYELLAKLLKKLGKERELVARLEKLRAAEPANVPLGCFLADRLRRAGEFDKAEAIYRQLLSQPPANAGCEGLISLERKRRNADALLAALGEAIDEKRASREAWEAIEAEAKADFRRRRRWCGRSSPPRGNGSPPAPTSSTTDSGWPWPCWRWRRSRYDLAGEFFDLAIRRCGRQAAADCCWRSGDWDCWTTAAPRRRQRCSSGESTRRRRATDRPDFYFYLSIALAQAGRMDEALAAARKAAELGKDVPRLCVRPAWILREAKRYDEAIAAFAAVLAKFDADADADEQTRKLRREAQAALAKGDLQTSPPPSAWSSIARTSGSPPKSATCCTTCGSPWPTSASCKTASPRAKSGPSRCWTSIPRTPPP